MEMSRTLMERKKSPGYNYVTFMALYFLSYDIYRILGGFTKAVCREGGGGGGGVWMNMYTNEYAYIYIYIHIYMCVA